MGGIGFYESFLLHRLVPLEAVRCLLQISKILNQVKEVVLACEKKRSRYHI